MTKTSHTIRQSVSPLLLVGAVLAIGAVIHCGSGTPTQPTTTTTTVPITTTTTTTQPGIKLPAGMVCSPTPPPLYGMQLKIHGGVPGRYILDSKPVVLNIDGYCERVVGHTGRFCETRVEGDPQRQACDYLVVGQAENGRWGPTWYWNNQVCGDAISTKCANHQTEQFLVIAKELGRYEACASDLAPISEEGSRCGIYDIKF